MRDASGSLTQPQHHVNEQHQTRGRVLLGTDFVSDRVPDEIEGRFPATGSRQSDTAPALTATQLYQDFLALLAVLGMILKYHFLFTIKIDGEVHVPLTVCFIGGLLAFLVAWSLLATHCTQKQRDLQKEADYVHRVIRVSPDLRLNLPELQSLYHKYSYSKDCFGWIREAVIALSAWRQAAAQTWKIYGIGMDFCSPMLLSTSLFLAFLPFRWLYLSRADNQAHCHFINLLTIAFRACLSLSLHHNAREACVGQLVTDPRVFLTMVKSALPVALACGLHPVGLHTLKYLVPGLILLYQLPFAYLTLHSPVNEASAAWLLALDMSDRFKCMLFLHVLPSALIGTLIYGWQHHCTCRQLSHFLRRKTRRIFGALLANRRI